MVNSVWFRYKGEGKSHLSAKEYVAALLKEEEYQVITEHYEYARNPKSENEWIRKGWGHDFDIFAVKYNKQNKPIFLFVEIDGEIHDKKRQKNRDENAEEVLRENYKNQTFILARLHKDTVLKDMKKLHKSDILEKIFNVK